MKINAEFINRKWEKIAYDNENKTGRCTITGGKDR